ncbi:MAG: zf-HC2 domain-containing protein, partial [Oligoflexia bacterium]|nr:zf-HC2 domain-containing protein [Oligoflexia bacterium]
MTHPVSWLRIERYHLGELSPEEQEEIARHLAACDGCRGILTEIEGDQRPLPALPALPPLHVEAAGKVVRGPARWWGVAAALAAAALGLVVVRAPSNPANLPVNLPADLPPAQVTVKGGVLAVELVREHAGVHSQRPTDYADGDRIQVRLSCPPGGHAEVAVIQGSALSWPLPSATCGSRVVAGAIRL